MGLSTRKMVGWALLSLGGGGTLLFGVALLTLWELPRFNEEIWLWPVTSTLLAVCATFFLRSQPTRLFLPFLRTMLPCLPAELLLRWIALRVGQSDDTK